MTVYILELRTASELREHDVRALPTPTAVDDADAFEDDASLLEDNLSPVDVWFGMETSPALVRQLTDDTLERGIRVTDFGQFRDTLATLSRELMRNRGNLATVGSPLGSAPLQSIYCGAEFAILGCTGSPSSKIMHGNPDVSPFGVHDRDYLLPVGFEPEIDLQNRSTGS